MQKFNQTKEKSYTIVLTANELAFLLRTLRPLEGQYRLVDELLLNFTGVATDYQNRIKQSNLPH